MIQGALNYYGWTNQEVIFQQDGNSSHTSKSTIKWMKKHKVNLLQKWPANSPDLNSIEDLWRRIKLKLARFSTRATNLDILWERFDKEWNKFTKNDMERNYNSIPRRIQEVIDAKDEYAKHKCSLLLP